MREKRDHYMHPRCYKQVGDANGSTDRHIHASQHTSRFSMGTHQCMVIQRRSRCHQRSDRLGCRVGLKGFKEMDWVWPEDIGI